MTAQSLTTTPLIWPRALPTPLPRFLLLAVLLHVWLVLLLGNAPGGTAPEGQGVFGSLNIVLQGSPQGPPGLAGPPPLPATPTGAPGEAEQQRFGGAVRSTLPQDPQPPGAAQLGDWSPTPGSQPDGQAAGAAPEPAPDTAAAALPAPAPLNPTPLAAVNSTPPAPVTSTPQAPVTPAPPVPLPPAAAPEPVATAVLGVQRNLPSLAAGDSSLQRVAPADAGPLPAVPAAPTLAAAAPVRQLAAAPLMQNPPQNAPQAALRPAPAAPLAEVPVLAAVPLPSATLPAASAERQLASRLPAGQAGAAAAALAGVGRVASAPVLATVPAPPSRSLPLPALVAPAPAPQAPVAQLPAPQAPVAQRPAALAPVPQPTAVLAPVPPAPAPAVTAVSAAAPAPSAAPLPTPALPPAAASLAAAEPALPQLPRVAPGAVASGAQPALPSTSAAAAAVSNVPLQSLPKPGPALPSPGQGAPDAGSRVGIDVATLPSAPASAPKRLNLELPRLRGGELSRYSTTGLLPALPRPPEVPDKLGSAIEKTAKEDCRKAYAGAGLLAVVPLAVDAVREGGCKW